MNNKKFCVIMCTNEITYENECRKFISELVIPDGFELEILPIYGAASMTSGYNRGMYGTDSKYKIYIHHDVYLINKNLLFDLLEIFSDEEIGMVGLVGVKELPESGVMWGERGQDHRIGKWIQCGVNIVKQFDGEECNKPYEEVSALDGLFIATQYDLPWREDIFTGWDFYDVSHAFEFLKAGYKVVVPYTDNSWCLHDSKVMNLKNYYDYRDVFLAEYRGVIVPRTEDNYEANYKRASIFKDKINDMLKAHTPKDYDVLCMLFNQQDFLDETVRYSTILMYAYILMVIISKEKKGSEEQFLMSCYSIEEFMYKWRKLKLLVHEIEFMDSSDAVAELKAIIEREKLTDVLLNELINMSSLDVDKVRKALL